MVEYIIMPKLGFNMDKGTLVKWRKKEGDFVKEQEVIFEIETDKTVMEVEAQTSGTLRKILVAEGEEVLVTMPIAIIGDKEEDISKLIERANQKLGKSEMTEEKPKAVKRISQEIAEKRQIEPKKEKEEFKKISPRAQRKAKELGVEVQLVEGSGPGGVVIEKDILDYFQLKRETSKTLIEEKEIEKRIPYAGIRKIIGERLSQSKFSAPHVYFTISIDMTKAISFLDTYNSDLQLKVTINDLIVFVVAKVLKERPNINCSLIAEEIVYYKDINIGIAVALEEGLIVPVLKNADKKNLSILSAEVKKLIKLARERKLMPDDYNGGTFTISNLGMYGIESFTAIINPPEAAILAVGEIKKSPTIVEEENSKKTEIRSIMKMTLSADHRLIDGIMAASFLNRIKYYLEFPEQLII
ncbi:MAG: 2-oxo acid dehydrogenase subunit E2 [Candidatus Atribacteria bacterium]|nr:2-oxo acid dehydrogenase subunit E2 [Candidatus Atribacteria bacterium]